MMPLDSKYWNLQNNVISCSFALVLTVFEILTFEIFDLEKVDQGHGVQHWQCRSQIANVKIYKRHILHFWFSTKFDLCECLSQTDRQLHDKPMAIGKIADFPKTYLLFLNYVYIYGVMADICLPYSKTLKRDKY